MVSHLWTYVHEDYLIDQTQISRIFSSGWETTSGQNRLNGGVCNRILPLACMVYTDVEGGGGEGWAGGLTQTENMCAL
jgi:hypothetical protein